MRILLDEIMNRQGLSNTQVSILTGIARSSISDIRNGTIPRMDTMEQLAAGLKMRISDLYESKYK